MYVSSEITSGVVKPLSTHLVLESVGDSDGWQEGGGVCGW